MEAAVVVPSSSSSSSSRPLLTFPANTKTLITTTNIRNRVRIPTPPFSNSKSTGQYSCRIRSRSRISVINDSTDVLGAADIDRGQLELSWQIIVGAIAGVTPFVVAGIEFTKRIIAQRRCEVCGGSGLVLRDEDYFRCPGCGGFLPWQSWKRFFTG